ncbi:unnamed protein product [Hydatigera taeniaeformis]|uniref:Uncharacterized protein n=1 Tax=Hydatigena taeniaeformis TaxID=6205 RepID=A0A0R3WP53_HYDTA|nr:unnamed protein product [Hydatigera taeniaeformis]
MAGVIFIPSSCPSIRADKTGQMSTQCNSRFSASLKGLHNLPIDSGNGGSLAVEQQGEEVFQETSATLPPRVNPTPERRKVNLYSLRNCGVVAVQLLGSHWSAAQHSSLQLLHAIKCKLCVGVGVGAENEAD